MKEAKGASYYLFSFFTVSMVAWFFEILYSLIFRSKLVFPGVLLGPWCPIYGVACLILFLLTDKKDYIILNFIKVFLVSAIVEYCISYVSEIFFHRRIWNYSNYFLNINGRICLSMTIMFTLGGLIWIYIIEPKLYKKFINNKRLFSILSFICLITIILDYAYNVFFKWKS
ncbi:MAG: putative ABC transporter permease [bacterium]|nr:putative ABC transporter permease [bacterium]